MSVVSSEDETLYCKFLSCKNYTLQIFAGFYKALNRDTTYAYIDECEGVSVWH
jgi:hypothetical protein